MTGGVAVFHSPLWEEGYSTLCHCLTETDGKNLAHKTVYLSAQAVIERRLRH